MTRSGPEPSENQVPHRYLRRIPWLATLEIEDLDRVGQRFRRRDYGSRETILRRGTHGGFLGIIGTGRVAMLSETPGGRPLAVTLQRGDYFAQSIQVRCSATLRTMTPVVLWTLDPADIEDLGWLRAPAAPTVSRLRSSPVIRIGLALVAFLLAWAIWASPPGQAFGADLRYARGCWYLERGQIEPALAEFAAALEMNPAQAASYNALGYIRFQQDRLEMASAVFEQAADLAADSGAIQNNLAVSLNYQGETEQALASLIRATELEGNQPQVYVNLGNLYLAQEDWLNAGRAYREALRLDPELARTHYNLGAAYYHLGQWPEARSEFEQASQIDPELAVAYVGLGIIAFGQDQFAQAQDAFQLAVEVDPGEAIAHYYLGLIHKEAGRRDQAAAAFEQALDLAVTPLMREQAEFYLKELEREP